MDSCKPTFDTLPPELIQHIAYTASPRDFTCEDALNLASTSKRMCSVLFGCELPSTKSIDGRFSKDRLLSLANPDFIAFSSRWRALRFGVEDGRYSAQDAYAAVEFSYREIGAFFMGDETKWTHLPNKKEYIDLMLYLVAKKKVKTDGRGFVMAILSGNDALINAYASGPWPSPVKVVQFWEDGWVDDQEGERDIFLRYVVDANRPGLVSKLLNTCGDDFGFLANEMVDFRPPLVYAVMENKWNAVLDFVRHPGVDPCVDAGYQRFSFNAWHALCKRTPPRVVIDAFLERDEVDVNDADSLRRCVLRLAIMAHLEREWDAYSVHKRKGPEGISEVMFALLAAPGIKTAPVRKWVKRGFVCTGHSNFRARVKRYLQDTILPLLDAADERHTQS